MQQFICLQIHTESLQLQETLIALLSANGFEAFEEKDNELLAYIDKQQFKKGDILPILENFKISIYSITKIENKNWNQQWERSFEPVVIGNLVAIRAGFHQPINNVAHQVIITPKMSFGTGHHATTYLMVQQMEALNFNNKAVIDFGTGTGVLAILAEKLGAKNIVAIDNDEWSVTNALENIESNKCRQIAVIKTDRFKAETKTDIILANINFNVITANLPQIETACNPGTIVLFSGLLVSDKENIQKHLNQYNFEVKNISERNGWLCLLTIYAIG